MRSASASSCPRSTSSSWRCCSLTIIPVGDRRAADRRRRRDAGVGRSRPRATGRARREPPRSEAGAAEPPGRRTRLRAQRRADARARTIGTSRRAARELGERSARRRPPGSAASTRRGGRTRRRAGSAARPPSAMNCASDPWKGSPSTFGRPATARIARSGRRSRMSADQQPALEENEDRSRPACRAGRRAARRRRARRAPCSGGEVGLDLGRHRVERRDDARPSRASLGERDPEIAEAGGAGVLARPRPTSTSGAPGGRARRLPRRSATVSPPDTAQRCAAGTPQARASRASSRSEPTTGAPVLRAIVSAPSTWSRWVCEMNRKSASRDLGGAHADGLRRGDPIDECVEEQRALPDPHAKRRAAEPLDRNRRGHPAGSVRRGVN